MSEQTSLQQSQYNFKTALVDFDILKKENSLPYKMQIKLQYLENKILNKLILKQDYKQLPQYELESLQQCDKPSQMMLFSSIVKCLSGKEVIVYFKDEKSYIKKQEAFSLWTKCYISCDSTFLYIKKKANKKTNYYLFKIRHLKVSKKFMEYKGRMCFGLMYQNKKYMIGFEQQTLCERIFKTLKQLVKENHPQYQQSILKIGSQVKSESNINIEKGDKIQSSISEQKHVASSQSHIKYPSQKDLQSSITSTKGEKKNLRDSQKISRSIMQFEQDDSNQEMEKTMKLKREQAIMEGMYEKIKKENFSSDSQFKLIKNFQIGRLLVDNNFERQQEKQVKTKTSVILSIQNMQIDSFYILQLFMEMKSWNLQVEECRIINKISMNSYKVFLQFKKYSLMSLSRWAIVTVSAVRLEKKSYLLIRSCEELTEQELVMGNYMSTVRMKKLNVTVELTQRPQQGEKMLMIVMLVADYGGYCSKQDNLEMSTRMVSNITNFYHYLLAQVINRQNKSRLFEMSKEEEQEGMMKKKQQRFLDVDVDGRSVNRKKSETISDISYDQNETSMVEYSPMKEYPQTMKKHSQREQEFQRPSSSKLLPSDSVKQTSQLQPSHQQADTILYSQFLKQFASFQQTQRGTQKLVEFILSKIQQRYYLKYRFPIKQTFQPDALRYNNDPHADNWLIQKGKWRINGVELVFTNQQVLAKQKNVIKFILKQLSSNVMAGKNIMNMSLPVEIFEDRSFLQKLGEVFGLFPYYFNLAAKQKNIVKQITLVSQAYAFATTIVPNIQKPFNPILGQTYQCTVGGVSLYFQQISHHPPLSAFYIKTEEYECYGSYNPNVDMGLNTAVAKNINPITVHFFQTNTKYMGYGQDFQIGGLMFGQRTYRNSGKLNVFEEKNQILCELSYGKNKKHIYESQKKMKTGDIIGGVFKVSNAFTKRFKHAQWKHFDGIKYDEKIEQLAKINGNWMGDLYVDGLKVRGMYDVIPYKPVKQTYVLPSDCSFRLDVFYKKMGDTKKSQQWKEVMQNLQRKDRKLREQYHGKGH